MKVYLQNNEQSFTIQTVFNKTLHELFLSIKGVSYIIEFEGFEQNYEFPITEKNTVVNKLINLDVSVEEVLELPLKTKKQQNAIYQIIDGKLEIAATYTTKIVDLFRDNNGKFDSKTTRWIFEKEMLNELINSIKNLGYDCKCESFPDVTPKKFKVRFFSSFYLLIF